MPLKRLAGGILAASTMLFASATWGQVRLDTSGTNETGNRFYKVEPAVPSTAGPAKLICATPVGEKGPDSIQFVRVLRDRTIMVAGNKAPKQGSEGFQGFSRGGFSEGEQAVGFIMRLEVKDDKSITQKSRVELPGKLNVLKLDKSGRICVLLDNACIYLIEPSASEPVRHCVREGIRDFDTDSTGELVVLTKEEIIRYDAQWKKEQWKAKIPCRGTNQGASVAVDPRSGVTVVLGSATAHTGRENWRGPYAHGYDREGKKLWTMWDFDPKGQLSKKDGGNDLMADTWGRSVSVGRDGKVYMNLMSVHERTVVTRDPGDVNKPLDPSIFEGSFEAAPGKNYTTYGQPGASVLFRVDPATGVIERGTWMNAWLTPDKKSNPLYMVNTACDGQGHVATVGYSEFGCPTKDPWYYEEDKFRGHGFLAIFDNGLQMLQCGYFHQTSITTVDAAYGYIVIGGQTLSGSASQGMGLKVHNPIQNFLSDNASEGYLAIFSVGEHGQPEALGPMAGSSGSLAVAPRDPPVKTTRAEQAAIELQLAQDLMRANKLGEARTKLDYILTRYSDTPSAAAAKTLMATLARDAAAAEAARTAAPTNVDPEDEKNADKLLQEAENYLTNKMRDAAKRKLQEITRKYPNTISGKKADKLLVKEFGI